MDTAELSTRITSALESLSQDFGTGNLVLDLLLLGIILSVVSVIFGLLAMRRSEAIQAAAEQQGNMGLGGRFEKLDMNFNDFKTNATRASEQVKVDLSFIKHELQYIRAALEGKAPPTGSGSPGTGLTGGGPYGGSGGSGGGLSASSTVMQETETSYAPPKVIEPAQKSTKPAPAKEAEAPASLSKRLSKTRQGFFEKLRSVFQHSPKLNPELVEELELHLIASDLGVKTVSGILEEVKKEVSRGDEITESALLERIRTKLVAILDPGSDFIIPSKGKREGPYVILMVGVNGVGKTTTCAKLASLLQKKGISTMLVAADTFRAAAVAQLTEWGSRIGVPVASGMPEAKPQAVVFDAMVEAKKTGVEVVIIDTAGRLHTKSSLMQELEGIRNTIQRHQSDAPNEVFLVVDGTTGQNAVAQAKEFNDAVKLSGVIVTKLDGTPKGGVVVAIKDELGVPVRFIGVGESTHDLRPFDAEEFVDAIVNREETGNTATESSAHAETRKRKRQEAGGNQSIPDRFIQ